jgi:hypothetical protein
MGKLKFVTALVASAAIFTALSLPASAQDNRKNVGQKAAPPRAAPVQRGPVTGARPGYQQAVRPGTQQGVRRDNAGYAARPGYAGRAPVAGRAGYAGRPGYAARPGFMRRSFAGRYYRGSLGWERGRWRHEWRNGRYGWWWDVGGAWYFYDQPVDGPPAYISDVEVLEDADMVEGPPPDEPVAVEAYPPPVVVAPAPIIVAPPPIVCVGPLCIR